MAHSFFLWLFLGSNLALLLGTLAGLACKVITVCGTSMWPTLDDGDRIVVLGWWPKCFLCKGQLVVSRLSSLEPTSNKPRQVKRIIALAGETITTSLSDIRQQEIQHRLLDYHNEDGIRTWYIPPQHVFVQGDNAGNSVDSVLHGPLFINNIQGVVLMKLPWTFLLWH